MSKCAVNPVAYIVEINTINLVFGLYVARADAAIKRHERLFGINAIKINRLAYPEIDSFFFAAR